MHQVLQLCRVYPENSPTGLFCGNQNPALRRQAGSWSITLDYHVSKQRKSVIGATPCITSALKNTKGIEHGCDGD